MFGDAAFCAEKLLNGWIERTQPISPELLRFVEQAANAFTQWVAQLRAGADTIDPASVYAAADLLQPGIAPAAAKPLEPQASAVATTVTIGTVVLSAELYQIFLGEAQRHVATLTQQADLLKQDPAGGMHEEFLRAAHTLGGIAGTAQMQPLSELGYALEALLQRMQSRPVADPVVVELLSRAIAYAAEMVSAIAQRQAPVVDESLTRAVQSALTEGPPDDPRSGLEPCTEGDSSHGETQTIGGHEHAPKSMRP
jgi:chemosensory pili system protein ChpA (sensor histidine kinase/response regulator)